MMVTPLDEIVGDRTRRLSLAACEVFVLDLASLRVQSVSTGQVVVEFHLAGTHAADVQR
jgi:hypothetical protein